jgi:hypothetical protein
MRRSKINLIVCAGLFLAGVLGCNMTTAKLGSLKIGKDKAVSSESASFAAGDPVYAIGTVSNAPGKVKVKGLLAFEDVEGQKRPIPGLEKTLELEAWHDTYTFTPPRVAQRKYKISDADTLGREKIKNRLPLVS